MKKKNEEDASVLRIKSLKEAFRLEIENYFVEHDLSIRDAITLITMTLHDIIERIAQKEKIPSDQLWGTFVKMFVVWDYLKLTKEG